MSNKNILLCVFLKSLFCCLTVAMYEEEISNSKNLRDYKYVEYKPSDLGQRDIKYINQTELWDNAIAVINRDLPCMIIANDSKELEYIYLIGYQDLSTTKVFKIKRYINNFRTVINEKAVPLKTLYEKYRENDDNSFFVAQEEIEIGNKTPCCFIL